MGLLLSGWRDDRLGIVVGVADDVEDRAKCVASDVGDGGAEVLDVAAGAPPEVARPDSSRLVREDGLEVQPDDVPVVLDRRVLDDRETMPGKHRANGLDHRLEVGVGLAEVAVLGDGRGVLDLGGHGRQRSPKLRTGIWCRFLHQ
jgi:hypothetical protein